MADSTRCVLLFSRKPSEEVAAKGLRRARPLFELAGRRIRDAVALLPDTDLLIPRQRGGSFGERLANALRDARALGYRRIVAVPADTPALGERHLRAAFEALESRDVVLGPAPDGGVYLIGVGGGVEVEPLLLGVRWRTSAVLRDLLAGAGAAGAALLPDWLADLDRPADLPGLRVDPALDPILAELIKRVLTAAPTAAPEAGGPPGRQALAAPISLRGPPALLLA
ncbi:MAG TPA: DUF2064 domain-containing protein [Candidatus Polarisedimenticolia bacterium]|jgi:hypothetical protein